MDKPLSSNFFSRHRWYLLWWAMLNLPFAVGHPGWTWSLEPLVRSLAVNLVLFIAPGMAFVGWYRLMNWRFPLTLLQVMLASFALFFGLLFLFQSAAWPITASALWNGTWAATNVLAIFRIFAAWRKPTDVRAPESSGRLTHEDEHSALHSHQADAIPCRLIAGLLFIAAYGLYYHAAVRVVPPQADHDLEVQGTGYGLVHRMEPLLLTDRGPHYYFAHPLLLHFYVGGSFLYFDQIEQLRPYDEASQRVKMLREGESLPSPSVPLGDYRIVARIGQDYVLESPHAPLLRLPVEEVETELIDSYYADHPGRLETRAPSMFLAAMTVAILGAWMVRLSGHWGIGLLAAATYATSPEIYVRSSYGGYFAISNFLVLSMLIAAAEWDISSKKGHATWACLLSGFLAGLANHKLALLPLSLAFVTCLRWLRSREPGKSAVHPTFLGFAVGTMMFWAHGLLIDAATFWKEHVRTHLVDRVIHLNPLGYSGYPTARDLWAEFCSHTGYVLLPLGLITLLLSLCFQRKSLDPSPGELSTSDAESVPSRLAPVTLCAWTVWMAVTALVYSLVDWRMTKHLTPLFLPLFILPVAWSTSGWFARIIVVVSFGGLFVWNVMVLRTVMADFNSLTITPAW